MRSLRWIFCVPALSILLSFPAEAPQRSAKLKIDRLEAGRWPPGGAVTFSAPELVALGMSEVAQSAAGAVSRPSLELRSGGGKAAATVDFSKLDRMRQGAGATSSDWLLSKLLTGQHEVSCHCSDLVRRRHDDSAPDGSNHRRSECQRSDARFSN